MLIQTHHHLATLVYQHVKGKYHLELSNDKLHFGSIIPDLNWKYLHIPHFFEGGFIHYRTEVRELLEDQKYLDIKEFSKKLGIILHFTADFFCNAHNDEEYKNNILSHLNYEMKLHNCFLEHERRGFYLNKYKNSVLMFMNLRKKYLELPASLEKDVEFIYKSCLELTDFLLETVLIPAVRKAA